MEKVIWGFEAFLAIKIISFIILPEKARDKNVIIKVAKLLGQLANAHWRIMDWCADLTNARKYC